MTNASFGSLTWLGLTICFQQMRRLSEIGGKMKCLHLHETSEYGTSHLNISEHWASSNELLPELVKIIKSIHSTPLFPKLVNYLDGIDMFIQNFKASELLPESATEEHFRYYSQIQNVYPRYDGDVVSSHNDLNPNNILFDGKKIWIIDWEAAFQNDRYVDLANVANRFVTNEMEE